MHASPTNLNNLQIQQIEILEDNSDLADKLSKYALPVKIYKTVLANDSMSQLNMYYMLPPFVNAAEYYPAVFDIYGGPNSQTVTREWSLGFDELLASNQIIVASVDPRGTGNRGTQFMYQVYGKLGKFEAEDVIVAARQFANFDYVDYGRLGLWGWSYGGYMALNTIIRGGNSVFQMSVSVAPVTDWNLYDTFYTERYMNTPSNNVDGYNSTSVLVNANGLKNFPFLVVHGTGDDNVHFQNSALLNERLVELGIQYDTMFYTNDQHSINNKGARSHLYTLLYNYINTTLASMPQVRQEITNN